MAKTLPEGIRKLKSGRYQVRYSAHGVQKTAGTYAKLQDAKDARNLALAEIKQGVWVDPCGPRMTVEEWVTEWQQLRNRYDTRTRSYLKVHILPAFGQQRLGQITPAEVQHWVRGLERKPSLNATTVRTIYAQFKQIMETAVDMDILPKSPCRSMIQLPKASKPKRHPLTVAQVLALEDAAEVIGRYQTTRSFRAFIHLEAWCGLRWQECAALRWENIDLSAGVIHVREAVKSETKKIGLPKNGKERIVPIGPSTIAVLTAHRRDHGGEGLLFTGRLGGQIDYGSYRKNVWYAVCDAAGITDPRPGTHALRHFWVSQMVELGVDPKVLSEAAGHYAPSFTLDRYGSPRLDGDVVLRAAVEEAMKR